MDRDKSLEMAIGQIEKQFGKGSVMRMGEKAHTVPSRLIVDGSHTPRPPGVCDKPWNPLAARRSVFSRR